MSRRQPQQARPPAPEPRLGICEPNGTFILTERYDPESGLPHWRYWIYAEGILREVITTDFGACLGGTAHIRPYTDPDDTAHPQKYLVAYHRNFTQAQIDDLRRDSASWFRECQGGNMVPYNKSETHVSRNWWGPTDRPHRTPTQLLTATQGQEGQGGYVTAPAHTLGRRNQMPDQETQQASNTSYTLAQPTTTAAWAPQPSQTTDTTHQITYTQQQQSLQNATSGQAATTTADTTTTGRVDINRQAQQAMLGHHRSDSHQQTVEGGEESDSSEEDPAIELRRQQNTQWFEAHYTRVVAGNGTVYYRDPQRQLWYVDEQGYPRRREDRR